MPVNFIGVEGTLNEKNENTYNVTWEVIGTNAFGPIEAVAAVGVNLYDSYNIGTEYDTTALCKARTPTPKPDSQGFVDLKHYIVVITYGRVDNPYINPLDEPVKTNIDFDITEEPVDFDIYGSPIMNSAGEPYAEAVMRTRPQAAISFSRNEASYSVALSAYYTGKLNLYPFLGLPKGTVMLKSRKARDEKDQYIGMYWNVNYEYVINLNGFKKKILNQGLRQLNYIPQGLYPCVDDDWNPVTSPVLLKKNGNQAPKNSTPIFHEYEVEDYADFSVFGF